MAVQEVGDGLFYEGGCGRLTGELDAAECKGTGHPDRLADDLAEALSRSYAKRTLELFGAPLHHNFDKLALLGGEAEVCYGSGRLIAPIRVLVNGRLATHFGDAPIPCDDWLRDTIGKFFAERLPRLDQAAALSVVYNLSTASSPGRVITPRSRGGRQRWFAPRDLDDLRERQELLSNDTSFGTGFAPLSAVQKLALELSAFLDSRHDSCSWQGTDTKVMTSGFGRRVDAVVCVPVIAEHTASREDYIDHLSSLREAIGAFVERAFPQLTFSLVLNNRDRLEEDELYLTAIGSSLESGDEGLVGRGNRISGLITPFSPMNLEGVCGKNPVYHCGKLYNVIAHRLAGDLHQRIGGQVQVNLISATGAPLDCPWRIQIRSEVDAPVVLVADIVRAHLSRIPDITTEFLAGTALASPRT